MTLRSFADCLRVGRLWVVLTLAFEWNRALRRGAFVPKALPRSVTYRTGD